LNDTIKIFQAETENGTNRQELARWYNAISKKTRIDRSELVQNMIIEDTGLPKSNNNKSTKKDK
jgi:DNA relaxase NicK